MASGAGLHFSGIINKFQESTSSPEKMRAVKPESIRNKVKEPVPSKPVYSFFETLNDPAQGCAYIAPGLSAAKLKSSGEQTDLTGLPGLIEYIGSPETIADEVPP